MNVWWCNQAHSWTVERASGVVCSTADCEPIPWHHKKVGEARKGDLIVHYHKPKIVAFSRATEDASYHDVLPQLEGVDYRFGWRFRTDYFDLPVPISAREFGKSLVAHIVKYYPVNENGMVNQGYFFQFDVPSLSLVLSHTLADLPTWLAPYRGTTPSTPIDARNLMEGALSRITMNKYERDPDARRLCVEHHGTRCQVCKAELGEHYGNVANGVIQVHHLKPLSERNGKSYLVDPSTDLIPVCPNCHVVIHLRKNPPYSIDEVRSFLSEAAGSKPRC